MSIVDAEGYTQNSLEGLRVLIHWWEDYPNAWNEDTDKTVAIELKYAVDHANDDPVTMQNDPLSGGLGNVLRRLMEINYRKQVTGSNLEQLALSIRSAIDAKLSRISEISEGSSGFSLSLSEKGDYFAQLSSRDPGGQLVPDPNGDVLRLKYVTHGNDFKFTVSRTFLAQLLDQIVNPFGVFNEGGPSFTVTFDTVTRVDIQLPHASSQGLQVLPSTLKLTGVGVHAENEDASLIINYVEVPISDAAYEYQMDLTGKVQGSLQGVLKLLTQVRFDEAFYSVVDDKLVMDLTQYPQRNFRVDLDYIDQQDQFRGQVHNGARVQIGLGQRPVEAVLGHSPLGAGYIPIGRRYAEGIRNVGIQVQVWRQVTNKPVGGHLVNEGGHLYAYYDDGVIKDLGPAFDPNDPFAPNPFPRWDPPPPGIKGGLVESTFLYVDYALQTITGRYRDNSIFKVSAGQQIRIAGYKNIPAMWLTVTMSGTRNGVVPNVQPPDPPRTQQSAVGVHV